MKSENSVFCNLFKNCRINSTVFTEKGRFLFILLILLIFVKASFAFDFGGTYENDPQLMLKKDGRAGVGDLNKLRLKLSQTLGEKGMLYIEPRYYYLIKSEEILTPGMTNLDQLIFNLAYLKYRADNWSLTAGKQRIAWGYDTIWNPVDVFNPFFLSFAVQDADRINVTALRAEVPVGDTGGVDLFMVTGDPWKSSPEANAKGLRIKGNRGTFDLALSYVDQGVLGHQFGFDTSGDLADNAGIRGQLVLKTKGDGSRYFQTVIGADYTLENGIGLSAEYFFNGIGSKDKNSYDWTQSQPGMDNLFFGANKILDQISNISGSIVMSLDDGSCLFYPQYNRSIAQNIDLNLAAMLLFGPDGSAFVPPAAFDPYGYGGSKSLLAKIIWNF